MGTEGGPTGRVFGSAGAGKSGGAPNIRMTCPLGRFGQTSDIANTAVFLASPGGSFITGTNIVVDGLQWQATGASAMLGMKDQLRAAMKAQKEGRERGTGSKGHSGDAQSKL